MEILVDIRQTKVAVNQDELRRKTEFILEGLGFDPSATISISVVDAEEMADLNLRYLGRHGPTNVLAFSQLEGEAWTIQPHLLGDVVICADRAVEDASRQGYTVPEMMDYLLIHGILHLAGYDHRLTEEESSMEAKVQELFDRLYPAADRQDPTGT